MRKLIAIFGNNCRKLKVYESKNKLRGEVYENDIKAMAADFEGKEADIYRIKEYFGFQTSYVIPFERKNKRIILYPVNKQKRIIWTNNDYPEWCEAMQSEITDEEITPEYYAFCCDNNLYDERCNLNVEVDGYIVAFASLGLWNGRVNGASLVGDNVNDIFGRFNDYDTLYCDPFNVRHESIHHDGTNYILYRVAKDKEHAEHLAELIGYHGMTEEQFRRATKSLRPYVAKVYGF